MVKPVRKKKNKSMLKEGQWAISTVAIHPGNGSATSTAAMAGNSCENYFIHPKHVSVGAVDRCLVRIIGGYITDPDTDLLPQLPLKSKVANGEQTQIRQACNVFNSDFTFLAKLDQNRTKTRAVKGLGNSDFPNGQTMQKNLEVIMGYLSG